MRFTLPYDHNRDMADTNDSCTDYTIQKLVEQGLLFSREGKGREPRAFSLKSQPVKKSGSRKNDNKISDEIPKQINQMIENFLGENPYERKFFLVSSIANADEAEMRRTAIKPFLKACDAFDQELASAMRNVRQGYKVCRARDMYSHARHSVQQELGTINLFFQRLRQQNGGAKTSAS